jgi:hypothetical protein
VKSRDDSFSVAILSLDQAKNFKSDGLHMYLIWNSRGGSESGEAVTIANLLSYCIKDSQKEVLFTISRQEIIARFADQNSPSAFGPAFTNWHKVLAAAGKTSNLKELSLFVGAKWVIILAVEIVLLMGAPKSVGGDCPVQMEVSIKFIRNRAGRSQLAFLYVESNPVAIEDDLFAQIVGLHCEAQVATLKYKTEPFVGEAHAMDLKFRAGSLNGGAKDMVRVEHNKRRRAIAV